MKLKEINHQVFYLQLEDKSITDQNELMVKMLKKKYIKTESNFLILDIGAAVSIDHPLVCFVLDLSKLFAHQPQNLILIDPEERFKRHLSMLHLNGIIESFKSFEEAIRFIEIKSTKAMYM